MGAVSEPGVHRGCGYRQQGGVYVECGKSKRGLPLEAFLVDPPVPMTVDAKVGVELIRRGDTYHILDHVGSMHYPNAADVLEEGRAYGFSRRVPKNMDFSLLTSRSRLLLVHANGLLVNHDEMAAYLDEALRLNFGLCGLHALRSGDKPTDCIRYLWALPEATEHDRGAFYRSFASVRYRVFPFMPDAPRPVTTSALIASLPITNISVIRAEDGSHVETLQRVRRLVPWEGGLSVTEADA